MSGAVAPEDRELLDATSRGDVAAVRSLLEEWGADVNLPDSWGYTPLHYAAVRGGDDLIEYLVSKGADVKTMSRMGQSAVDMTRGGRNGFFSRTPYPQTMELLLVLCSQSLFRFADLGDDGLCRGGPDKGCGVIVSAIDVVVDRLD